MIYFARHKNDSYLQTCLNDKLGTSFTKSRLRLLLLIILISPLKNEKQALLIQMSRSLQQIYTFYQAMLEMQKEDEALTDCSIIIQPNFSSVLKSITEPQFKCKGGFEIDHICTNKNCKKSAFHCSSKECQCFKNHKFCQRNWFNGYTTLIQLKEKFQKTFFEKIYETDNEVIKKIQESNEEMASHISLGSFEDKYLQILNKIYLKKDWENFLGAEMEDLYCKLMEESHENKERETVLQKIYEARAIHLAEEGIKFKKEIFKAYLNGSLIKDTKIDEWKPFIDSPLIRTCFTTMYANTLQCYKNKAKFGYCYLDKLDADRMAFQKEYIGFLQKELYNAVSAELIFTASQHQFKIAEFHKKCDGVENTLTVVRTEHGKTIFAFAAQKWSSVGSYVNDPSGRSCIILLDQKKKYSLVNAANSIYCNSTYGPTFGNGHDLYLPNDCHINNSHCNFPTAYNNNGLANSQVSWTTISGCPSNYSFKVIQYEVFKLTFQL